MITIILRSKKLANGEHPIVLRVTKDRKSKIISLGLSCLKSHWKSSELVKKHTNSSMKNRIILKQKEKALKIIDNFNLEDIDFTLNQFEDEFRGRKSSKVTVSEFWKEKASDLNRAGRTGNARAYKDVCNSFFKFYKNKNLVFREITLTLLDKYETYLRSKNNSDRGIGVKMHEIRALFNDAVKKGVVDEKYYPFKTYKVSKLKGKGLKKALTRDEMKLMETLNTEENPNLIDAKNYMLFSYYMAGMKMPNIKILILVCPNFQLVLSILSMSLPCLGSRLKTRQVIRSASKL